MTQKTILFTGGGSAGHVTPNLALIKKFQEKNWRPVYIGSINGIEKEIIAKTGIPYYGIATGKLRRYFSWQNFIDPFKVIAGFFQAFFLCRKLKPAVVFSKGGFVAFPVVVAAWLNRIPVIAHESDLTPGLANRLSYAFAKVICLTFAESKKYFKSQDKLLITGTPLREELFTGDADKGRNFCGFSADKKTILVVGGGLGAKRINDTIRALLPQLLIDYQVIHLCGKGKLAGLQEMPWYKPFEYLHEELADVMAFTDLVISRAGANSLYELLALKKPHILIPLPKAGSRGDQIANAKHFADLGLSQVILEEQLTPEKLLEKIGWMQQHQQQVFQALQQFQLPASVPLIQQKIEELSCTS
jgi:UDP-N-acetylglucosamine--N-acetylmuramyl-(pentapeptide) pyrophosphoryl-undecaprenol N-acetylglucosamine transferase